MTIGDIYGLKETISGFQEVNLNDEFSGGSFSGGYLYFAQSATEDTVGDWRKYGDINGFYTQYCSVASPVKGNGTWTTKHTIQI